MLKLKVRRTRERERERDDFDGRVEKRERAERRDSGDN